MDRGARHLRRAPDRTLHVHHEDDEAWYVLQGTLGFRGESSAEIFRRHASELL